MERLPSTRMGLLAVRARAAMAGKGASILRGKRSALADEFFRLMQGVLEGRRIVDEKLSAAGDALVEARALDGEDAVAALAVAARRDVPVEIKTRKVWGIPTPEVSAPRVSRALEARGASELDWSLASEDAARRYEEVVDVLLSISSREALLRRLGDEIRDTSRRVNALEQAVLPALRREKRRIAQALEERERDEIVRLKRLKRRRDA